MKICKVDWNKYFEIDNIKQLALEEGIQYETFRYWDRARPKSVKSEIHCNHLMKLGLGEDIVWYRLNKELIVRDFKSLRKLMAIHLLSHASYRFAYNNTSIMVDTVPRMYLIEVPHEEVVTIKGIHYWEVRG